MMGFEPKWRRSSMQDVEGRRFTGAMPTRLFAFVYHHLEGPRPDAEEAWRVHLEAADGTSAPDKTGDGGAETPEQAVTNAFKRIQASLRDGDYKTTWVLTATLSWHSVRRQPVADGGRQ